MFHTFRRGPVDNQTAYSLALPPHSSRGGTVFLTHRGHHSGHVLISRLYGRVTP